VIRDKSFNAGGISQSMREKFMTAMRDKKSQLCVGLDPRPETGDSSSLLDFCFDIVEETSDFCFCYKPNTQYILPMGFSEIKALNDLIHEKGCLSISDHKLSDIGSTNRAALFWLSSMGFDALTYSPFPGNIKETIETAAGYGLGVITLTLMSNPEADYFMKGVVKGEPGYEFIAEQVAAFNGLGAVVGATCTIEDIRKIHGILSGQLILSPGVGAQGGGLDIVRIFKERTMVNVSRDIITHENPAERARFYQDLINNAAKEM
jgi:orotidine 5'-phosphate decarboxylase subfamily 2